MKRAGKVFNCIIKVGSNIGPAAAESAGPVPTPLTKQKRMYGIVYLDCTEEPYNASRRPILQF